VASCLRMDQLPSPPRVSPWLVLRATVWSLLFAGTVVGYVPWRFFGVWRAPIRFASPVHILGLAALVVGTYLMFACIREFARRGRGTPAPMDPPRELVVHGPYRYVRNPMYLGATLALIGELLLAFSPAFLGYAITWFVAVSLLVVAYEEPTLREKFGESYVRYTRRVRRWLPSFRRRDNDG